VLVDFVRDPAWRARAWRVPLLDIEAMAREAEAARGTHDFAAFRSAGDDRPSTERTLFRVDVVREDDPRIAAVVVEGTAFLYNMVRILVGTMVDVGRGRLEVGAVGRALESRERCLAGTTAPAHGLVLEQVDVDLPSGTGEPWPR
jgi:tRNA pseudouridine38-40 synthase